MKFHSSRIAPLLIGIGGSSSFSDAFVTPQFPTSSISSFGHDESIPFKRSQSSTHEQIQLHSLPKFFQQLSQNASINFTPNTSPSKEPSKSQTNNNRSSQLNASKTMVKEDNKTSTNDPEKASNTKNTPRPPSTPPQIYENRVNILQHALMEKTQLVQTLERRLALVTDATQKLQVSNRDLLSQLQVLQGSSSLEQPPSSSSSSSSSSDAELEQLQQLEQEFQSSTRAYQSKLESKQSKYRTLQSAYRSLESQLQSLEKEHDRVQADVAVLTTKLEASELECEGLEIQSLQQLEEIELLEQELDLMQASQKDEEEESTVGRISLETATTGPLPNEQEEQVKKELEEKIESLQGDKESLQNKLDGMEKSYETAKQQFQELNQVYKDRRGKLESLLQEEKQKSASLESSLAKSEAETKRVLRERNVVQDTLDSVNTQFHELQQRIQDMRHHSKVNKKNARISHAAYQLSKGRNEELEEQVTALSIENEELQNQLQQYQRMEREQFVDQSHWKGREDEWKSHIEGLYSRLAQLSNQCTTLRNEKQIIIQKRKEERLAQETLQAKEKMEWKMNLVNLKSDYEELIEGFKEEIDRLKADSITEDASINDDTNILSNTRVISGTEDQGLEKDIGTATKEVTDEGVGALSKRKRVRRFLRNKALIAKEWCTRTTHRFSDSF